MLSLSLLSLKIVDEEVLLPVLPLLLVVVVVMAGFEMDLAVNEP